MVRCGNRRANLRSQRSWVQIPSAVGDAFAQSIDEGVLREIARLGGDGGQRADDLILHNIVGGTGSGMGVAIVDVINGAFIMAGIVLGFAEGLLQRGNAGKVLGIHGDIVNSAVAAIAGVIAVHRGHGQGYEEGGGGGSHHLRNAGLDHEVQTQRQAGSGGLAIGISLRHCNWHHAKG